MIDYNMPITMAYMKHMKLQLLNSQQDEVKWKYLRLYRLHVRMKFDNHDYRVKHDGILKTVIYFLMKGMSLGLHRWRNRQKLLVLDRDSLS